MVGDSLTSDIAGGNGAGLHTAWIRHGRSLMPAWTRSRSTSSRPTAEAFRLDPQPSLTHPARRAGRIRLDLAVTEASTFEEVAGTPGHQPIGPRREASP